MATADRSEEIGEVIGHTGGNVRVNRERTVCLTLAVNRAIIFIAYFISFI